MKTPIFKKGDRVILVSAHAHKNYGIGTVADPCREIDMLWGVMPNLEAVEFYVDVEHDARPGEILGWHQESLRLAKLEESLHDKNAERDEKKDWIADLKRELFYKSARKDSFTFSSDELIELLGGLSALTKDIN